MSLHVRRLPASAIPLDDSLHPPGQGAAGVLEHSLEQTDLRSDL